MLSVDAYSDGALKAALNESGWLDQEVVAAGQLRQGKMPSLLGFASGAFLIELIRRRTKVLPRHFVMAVTADRITAYKAVGGGSKGGGDYTITVFDGERGSLPRASVTMSELPDGAQSKGGTMTIGDETFPVMRPNLNGDPNTDELIALLAGLQAPGDEPPEVPPASRGDLVV